MHNIEREHFPSYQQLRRNIPRTIAVIAASALFASCGISDESNNTSNRPPADVQMEDKVLAADNPGVAGKTLPSQEKTGSEAAAGKEDSSKLDKPQQTPIALKRPWLGVAVRSKFIDSPDYMKIVKKFDVVVPENEAKMFDIIPDDPLTKRKLDYKYDGMDKVVGMAEANGQLLRGHTFVFGGQDPWWIQRVGNMCNKGAPAEGKQWAQRVLLVTMQDYISKVSERYQNKITEWDVVNEPMEDNGTFEQNAWYKCLGAAYIEAAFRMARQANPKAKLFLNEIGAEQPSPRRDGLETLARTLRARGVPIDGIGLQSHFSSSEAGRIPQIEQTIKKFGDMGLEVRLTELDVSMPENPIAADYENQAAVYRAAVTACKNQIACKGIMVWGASDEHSWRSGNKPTLFYAPGRPKPAYDQVREILK